MRTPQRLPYPDLWQSSRFLAGDGSNATPSYAFASEPTTGMFRISSGIIRFVSLGNGMAQFSQSQTYLPGIISYSATPLKMVGQVADGATAIGAKIGAYNNMVTPGAKLLSVVNNDTIEKVYIDKDGLIYSASEVSGTLFRTTTASTSNSTGTVAIVGKDANPGVNNAGWLPMKISTGATVYMPYWI